MKFLGLATNNNDDRNPYNININVSSFLNKLNMPIQLTEILKLPSMHGRDTSHLGIPPKQISVIPKDKPIMI